MSAATVPRSAALWKSYQCVSLPGVALAQPRQRLVVVEIHVSRGRDGLRQEVADEHARQGPVGLFEGFELKLSAMLLPFIVSPFSATMPFME